MTETILCISLIFNIIGGLAIAKLVSMVKEMTPIIDQIYTERHGEDK